MSSMWSFPVSVWQNYASPVWLDINPSNTLQRKSARAENDERHICPLQLDVVARALRLWTNPGDIVLSPFAGIGSEGTESLRMGRKFIGIELKQSYYDQAVLNLRAAEEGALDAKASPIENMDKIIDMTVLDSHLEADAQEEKQLEEPEADGKPLSNAMALAAFLDAEPVATA